MKINGLKWLVASAALAVAGCAAFFSVKGIAMLFSGAFVATLIMASVLEGAKLVATSFLYRWWDKCSKWLRVYLTIAVVVLMFVTSLGIFGFLSSAYQDSALKHEVHMAKIEAVESKVSLVDSEIKSITALIHTLTDVRKDQEGRLNSISEKIGKTLTARGAQALQESTQKLIADSSEDISKSSDKLEKLGNKREVYQDHILDLKVNNAEIKDIQTFQFVAEQLGMTLDSVAKWFILIIIGVFDPLAIALVLAYNVMVAREEKDTKPVEAKKKELTEKVKSKETLDDTFQLEYDTEPNKIAEEVVSEKPVIHDVNQQTFDLNQLRMLEKVKTKKGEIKNSHGEVIAESNKIT